MACLNKPAYTTSFTLLFLATVFLGCKDPYSTHGTPTPPQESTTATKSAQTPEQPSPTTQPSNPLKSTPPSTMPSLGLPSAQMELPSPRLGQNEEDKWPKKALFTRKEGETPSPTPTAGLGLQAPTKGFGLGLTMPSLGDNSGLTPPSQDGLSLQLNTNENTDTTEPSTPTSQPTSQPTSASSRPTSTPHSPQNTDTQDTDTQDTDTKEAKANKKAAPSAPAPFSLPTSGVIAMINSEEIDAITFRVAFEQAKQLVLSQQAIELNDAMLDEIRKKTLEGLVSQILISQKAAQIGVPYGPQEQREAIRLFLAAQPAGTTVAQFLRTHSLTEAQFSRYLRLQMITNLYMQHIARDYPLSPQDVKRRYDETLGKGQVRVRHILINLSETPTPEEIQKAETRAQKILTEVQAPKADFADLAKKRSDDLSGEQGGDLGFLGSGDAVKELDHVIFSMDLQEIRGPIRSSLGFHILQVTHKKAPPPFAQVQEQLVRELRMGKLQSHLENELKKLKHEADIEYKVSWAPKDP